MTSLLRLWGKFHVQLLQYCLRKLWNNFTCRTNNKSCRTEQSVSWPTQSIMLKPINWFELLRWNNAASQRQTKREAMVFKFLRGLVPQNLCSKFDHRESACCLRDAVYEVIVPSIATILNYNADSTRHSLCSVKKNPWLLQYKPKKSVVYCFSPHCLSNIRQMKKPKSCITLW